MPATELVTPDPLYSHVDMELQYGETHRLYMRWMFTDYPACSYLHGFGGIRVLKPNVQADIILTTS